MKNATTTTKTTRTKKQAKHDAMITEIATQHFFIDTIETQNSDSLDFHDVSVWEMKSALEAAFAAGQAAGK